jgi:demethylmenaquinone methyltransferase/2-methoxy-6-polyprenyl-1,4-benzoquinol methylase
LVGDSIVWWEVEDALEKIIDDYEKVNHIISIFQDDRARIKGLLKLGLQSGVGIELGSGPGNFSRMIDPFVDGHLICLDFSDEMLSFARNRNYDLNHNYVRAVFEALPFREKKICFMAAAYAIRDSIDKLKTISEIEFTLKKKGTFLIVDIGKPNNRLIQAFMRIYMRFIVPILGGLAAGYGYKNPWSILFKTFEMLPSNNELVKMMEKFFGFVSLEELTFGALVIGVAKKSERRIKK